MAKRSLVAVMCVALVATMFVGTPAVAAPGDQRVLVSDLGNGTVSQIEITPNSSHVVYIANSRDFATRELWSVRVAGGSPQRLSGRLGPDRPVTSFALTPNSEHVLYTSARVLYSVRVDGGGRRQLSPDGAAVFSYEMSPDGTTVLMWLSEHGSNPAGLYSVPARGGTVTNLSGAFVQFGAIKKYAIAPDSSRVVFTADKDTFRTVEIYSVPLRGGAVTKLNSDLNFGDVDDFREGNGFVISPDSQRVVFFAQAGASSSFRLFSVPIVGGAMVELNSPLVLGGNVQRARISPDSSMVVYQASQDDRETDELYAVPIDGGTVRKISHPLNAGQEGSLETQITADSQSVVYAEYTSSGGTNALYTAYLDGRPPQRLTREVAEGGSAYVVDADPESEKVYYATNQRNAQGRDLYEIDRDGTDRRRVHPRLRGDAFVSFALFSQDGQTIVYYGDVSGRSRLPGVQYFAVPRNGGSPTEVATAGLGRNERVIRSLLTPDSRYLIAVVDGDPSRIVRASITDTPTCFGEEATIVGTSGDDVITGTSGRDVIVSLGGADTINGLGGNDLICAGSGRDVVRAGGGNDRVNAGPGGDTVSGQGGRDRIDGGGGRDRLNGGRGADTINGNGGRDTIRGGPGNDVCSGGGGRDDVRGC